MRWQHYTSMKHAFRTIQHVSQDQKSSAFVDDQRDMEIVQKLQTPPSKSSYVPIPVHSIYAQSWPIPKPDTIVTHSSFSSGRSLNDNWCRAKRKQTSDVIRGIHTRKGSRATSAQATRCSSVGSRSNFLEREDDEIDDTMEEFRMTMQLFKRLTKQVREVNQYMNTHRISYSFKHYLNNGGITSPALRRSQLAAALSKREIPATQAPFEPITDLGPPTLGTRPVSRCNRDPQSFSPGPHPTSVPPRPSTSCHVYARQPSSKGASTRTAMDKKREKALREADQRAKEEWIENDKEFSDLFVPEQVDPEEISFRFHDPYPRTWVDETVEDACFRGSKKVDPFMHRLEELENVQEETVLWEKLKEDKARQSSLSLVNKQSSRNNKYTKAGSSNRGGSARYPSTKITSVSTRVKSSTIRHKRTSSAGKSSTTSNPVSGSEESDIATFRNSGYNMDVSFIPGSMYPETRPKPKQKRHTSEKDEKLKTTLASSSSSSSTMPSNRQTSPIPKIHVPHCEACHLRKSTVTKKHARGIPTLKTMQSQYALKATESYNILNIAETFEAPCSNKVQKPKHRPSTAEKAAQKGLVPSKSLQSQRRISLTDEGMTVRGINPALARPSTGHCKPAKGVLKYKQKT